VWIGMIAALKALPIFLKAMATLRDATPGLELRIVGSGPQEASCRALARNLGMDARIRWVGGLSHLEALTEINNADALVFTSLQEGTPHVVLEALSLGVPVICHDACGMGAAVTRGCGIKVPMRGISGSIEGFAEAIRSLHDRPEMIEKLSAGAIQRSSELSWTQTARQIADAYQQVLKWRGRGGAGA
jgi:glycosyltransferase involved in cell wall biosynthesis